MRKPFLDGMFARPVVVVIACVALAVALASCSGGQSSGSAAYAPARNDSSSQASANGPSAGAPGQAATPGSAGGPQYVSKALTVNMAVNDPRQTAAELQTWVTTTDPHASSAGLSYQQIGTNAYDVSLTFAVEASLYPQVETYLASYPEKQHGQLVSLQEAVQDVTNDYIDSQARLSNLRNEQQRLQAILDRAQSLSDVLTVEQQVTQVEGQIEQIEAHLNALNGQTTFYRVTINLAPLGSPEPGQPPRPAPFDPGRTLRDALAAALVVAEWLATVLIWVGVFGVFALPIAAVALLVRRRVLRGRRVPVPA